MTLVCSVWLEVVGIEIFPMATLLVFIIGLLPLSCHHSEHFSSQGIVFWDSGGLGWLGLLSSVAHCHCVMLHAVYSHSADFPGCTHKTVFDIENACQNVNLHTLIKPLLRCGYYTIPALLTTACIGYFPFLKWFVPWTYKVRVTICCACFTA